VLAAVDLALSAARRLELRAGPERERLVAFLLAAARRGLMRGEVLRAPMLLAIEDGRSVARSLLDLGAEADASPGRAVWVLEPDADASAMLLPEGPAYRIATEPGARIAALLHVRFRPVLPREARGGLSARLRRTARDLRGLLRRAGGWLRHPRSGRVLGPAEIGPEERALLRALGPGVALTAGAGPVRRTAGEWRLPRANPLVAAAARAVARDPLWLYPAALGLFEARRPLPPGCADPWAAA
jgi:hypothetical protein